MHYISIYSIGTLFENRVFQSKCSKDYRLAKKHPIFKIQKENPYLVPGLSKQYKLNRII